MEGPDGSGKTTQIDLLKKYLETKGYDIIRNSFLIALRKLANANYNIIFISHEETEIVKDRIGRESTNYKTSLPDKVAKKVAGMVEITGRISCKSKEDENGNIIDTRILQLASTKDQFGGNKIPTINIDYVNLSYEDLIKAIKGGK